MAGQYITKQGDRLDLVCYSVFGLLALRLFFDHNPGLADQELLLPAGVTIALPSTTEVTAATEPIAQTRLWD